MAKINIGSKVVNKDDKIGTITSFDGKYVTVTFDNSTIKYVADSFKKGFLRYLEDSEQEKVNRENEKAVMREEQRKAKLEEERMVAKENEEKANEAKKVSSRPQVAKTRSKGKTPCFLVCQNSSYEIESAQGYIWAPFHLGKGDGEKAYHQELEYVKKGDIIIHHFANKIYAISIAKKDWERKAAGSGRSTGDEVGRYVELEYHILANPADTSNYKEEKRRYGSHKYGPFTKDGDNKQGFYLSELDENLAKLFIDVAIDANKTDSYLPLIKAKL